MPHRPLTRQLLSQILLYTLLFGMAITALKATLIFQDGQQRMNTLPTTVSRLYLPLLAQSAWEVDIPTVQLQLQLIGQIPGVKSVELNTEMGQSLHYDNPDKRDTGVSRHYQLPLQSPVTHDPLGTLTLDVSDQDIYKAILDEVLSSTIEYLLALSGLALLIWLLFNRHVITPIKELAGAMQDFSPGKPLNIPATAVRDSRGNNELAQLTQAFSNMGESINQHLQDRSRIELELSEHRDQLAQLVNQRTAELHRLLQFQQLVAEISTRFINIPLDDIDQASNLALGEIGRFMQVERAYLIGFDEDWLVESVHEWCASGIQPTTAKLLGQSLATRTWAYSELYQHGVLSIDSLDALPAEAVKENEELRQHQVQSLFMLRIDHMGRAVGLFGCDMVSRPRRWLGEERQQARVLGEMLANTITRRQQLQELSHTQQQLHAANANLARMAFSDGLTGIANRRHFDDQLNHCHAAASIHGTPLSVLQIDIDHFKQYNDSYGHLAGDHCLRQVAQTIQQNLPEGDCLVARVGGEEFGVLLPGYTFEAALKIAEALRQSVWELAIAHEKAPHQGRLSISIGLASLLPGQTCHQLMSEADQALYAAKRHGRNRVEHAA